MNWEKDLKDFEKRNYCKWKLIYISYWNIRKEKLKKIGTLQVDGFKSQFLLQR